MDLIKKNWFWASIAGLFSGLAIGSYLNPINPVILFVIVVICCFSFMVFSEVEANTERKLEEMREEITELKENLLEAQRELYDLTSKNSDSFSEK